MTYCCLAQTACTWAIEVQGSSLPGYKKAAQASLNGVQILRERVAVGRKLVEAITAALPARRVEAVATTPLGQRSRRAKGEPALQRSSSAAAPKPSGAPGLPLKPVIGQLMCSQHRLCCRGADFQQVGTLTAHLVLVQS